MFWLEIEMHVMMRFHFILGTSISYRSIGKLIKRGKQEGGLLRHGKKQFIFSPDERFWDFCTYIILLSGISLLV